MSQDNIFLITLLMLLIWSAAVWDLYQRRIPNFLVMAGAATGILLQWMLVGSSGFLATIYGLGVGLAILMPGYLLGFTGAGDVKLMAAVGTFLGPHSVFLAALISISIGSMIALGFAASSLFSHQAISPWSRYGLMLKTLAVTGKPIYVAPVEGEVMGKKFPFAVSIALGTTGLLAWQWWSGVLV